MLKINYDNCINFDHLEVTDLVKLEALQKFQDSFANATGCAGVIIDRNGKAVTNASNYCKYCMYYVRSSKNGEPLCTQSHKFFAQEALRLNRVYFGKCHAGITEFAVPLKVSGEYLGAFIGGQFVTEKIREAEVRELAQELDVDYSKLLEAKKELRRVDKRYIESVSLLVDSGLNMSLLHSFTKEQLEVVSEKMNEGIDEISENMNSVNKNSELITGQQKALNESISNVETASTEIQDVLSSITQLADQTTILGFNAQIESARAGEFGKSFAIVAGEITELAESSKKTADNISELTQQIKTNINDTVENSGKTLDIAMDQRSTSRDAIDKIDELKELSALFKKTIHTK